MSLNRVSIFTAVCIVSINYTLGQESINSTGSVIKTDNGSIAYSAGQISYSSQENGAYLLSEGVIQIFEFSENNILEVDDTFSINIFPNPSKDFITIKTTEMELVYQIRNLQGIELTKAELLSKKTRINLDHFQSKVLILTVSNKNGNSRNFKIIKK